MRNVKRNEFLFVEEIFVKNSFEKGKRSTFFFAKKKKVSKKKCASKLLDRLLTRPPDKVRRLVSALPHGRHAEGLFLTRKGFGTRVVRLQSLMLPHGGFCPTKCGENVCFSYWGLNKTVGISSVPSAHRARSAKLRFDEGYQKNRERRNTLAPSKTSTLAWAFAKSFAGFSHRNRKRSTCKVANFFFGTFFFLGKKKVHRSPCQGIFVILL